MTDKEKKLVDDDTSHERYENQQDLEKVINQIISEQDGIDDSLDKKQQDYKDYQSGVNAEDYIPEDERKVIAGISTAHLDGVKSVDDGEGTAYYVPTDKDQNASDFWKNHHPSLDTLEGNEQLSQEEAHYFAMLQGLESTLRSEARANSSLTSTVKQNKLLLVLTIGQFLLLCVLVWAFFQFPKTRFVATANNEAICAVEPQNNPNITDSTISEFAKTAVIELYSFDFINNVDYIDSVLARYFSSEGRSEAVKVMRNNGLIDHVNNNALVLRATAANAPRIEEKGFTPTNEPFWVVRFPVVIDVYSGNRAPVETQRHLVTVHLKANKMSKVNPTGLEIYSVVFTPYNR